MASIGHIGSVGKSPGCAHAEFVNGAPRRCQPRSRHPTPKTDPSLPVSLSLPRRRRASVSSREMISRDANARMFDAVLEVADLPLRNNCLGYAVAYAILIETRVN